MKDTKTIISGELFTHKILWECCELHSRAAEKAAIEKAGSFCYELTAMLFAYLTYEAYLNFLGERVAPDVWRNERQFFNREPYRGIAGKLKKIAEVCNINHLDAGSRPYQTIVELCRLRDFLTHAKPDKYELAIRHTRSNDPRLFHSKLNQLVTPEKMKRGIEDVRSFVEFLHCRAASYVSDFFFGNSPLEGIVEHSVGDDCTIT